MFKDKILLITGGTGSFGHQVLKRFIDTDIKEIRIFSRDEKKQDDMRNLIQNDKVKYYIGDVRDYNSIADAMKDVNYVFHAAALKQVPSCEFYPMEAIKTNVQGSDNVFRAAKYHNVERVVLLSTDKAVYPVNAMGISKAMAEKCMIAASRNVSENETVFLFNSLWKCYGFTWIGYSFIRQFNERRKRLNNYRSKYDTLHDVT